MQGDAAASLTLDVFVDLEDDENGNHLIKQQAVSFLFGYGFAEQWEAPLKHIVTGVSLRPWSHKASVKVKHTSNGW